MRSAAIAVWIGLVGLMAVPSAEAAPAAPHEITVTAPELTLVRGGCGRGWHARRWRDRYGRWHVRCVRYRHY
jgi:hypothetical protein